MFWYILYSAQKLVHKVLQFFLCIKNKLTNGSHSTDIVLTLPRHSLHSECHMILRHICKWAFIYVHKKMMTFTLHQFSLHTQILDLVLFWSLVLNFTQNQTMYIQSMYWNLFSLLSKAWFSLCQLLWRM